VQKFRNPIIKIAGVALALLVITMIYIEDSFFNGIKENISSSTRPEKKVKSVVDDEAKEHVKEKPDEHGGNKEHDEQGEHDEHDEDEKVVSISPEEMTEFNIKLKTAGPEKLETYVNLPGEIVVNADRLAHIVPRIPGIVRKVRNNLGDIVQPGRIMAILESSELGEAKTEYFTRKKQLEMSEIDLSRAQTIHDNTKTLLQLLKTALDAKTVSEKTDIVLLKTLPDIETVVNKTAGLDMGENRKLLISTYTQFLLTYETYKRERNLFEKKISSQSDYLLAESAFKSAQATYAATYDEVAFSVKRQLLEKMRALEVSKTSLRASERHLHVLGISEKEIQILEDGREQDFKIARIEIKAPIGGTVIEKHITLGEMLEKDAKAFVLADLSSVWVNLSVYQKDMALIRKGMEVIISGGKNIPEFKGEISYVRSLVGDETRTTLARVVIPNPKGTLRPGIFVNGKVVAEKIKVPLAVPKSALQTIDNQTIVFVKTDEGLFPQPVKTGKTSETHTEIISGMKSGQQYVSEGGFTLKAQLAKGGFEAGHSH
jgi:cobalt-zinc-cadmium efflux system membrane fusion protein